MSDQTPAQRFQDALRKFESEGDDSDLLEQYAADPELLRPEVDKDGSSTTDPGAFWEAYRAQFSELSTEFTHVEEGDAFASLEWVSRGTLSAGRDIEYAGVSLLTFDDEGRVSRFATYYDTAAFLTGDDLPSG
jgi:ketosteroid isomerase-like protein